MDHILVKELVWENYSDGFDNLLRAETDFGIYRVWKHGDQWFWHLDGYRDVDGDEETRIEAEYRAQSDFEKRVLSLIEVFKP